MLKTDWILRDKRRLTHDVWELDFEGCTSPITNPGQFVNLAITGQYLRRPISVCDWRDGAARLICRAMGQGTQTLCDAEPGTKFDVLVGLGNGFDPEKTTQNPVLVGGGVGVPPLFGLARRLLAAGVRPVVALGFASKADCFYQTKFESLGCEVHMATVDGSLGHHGFVTELVPPECDYVYCCGPEPMLKAVYNLPQLRDGQFSFEERMGCGFGACVGCTCKTKYGYKRICKDGPILCKEEIVW